MTVLLLAACGGGTEEKQDAGKRDGPASLADTASGRDAPAADQAANPPEAGPQPDRAADQAANPPEAGPQPDRASDGVIGDAGPADGAPADLAPDIRAGEAGPPDVAPTLEAGAAEVQATLEVGSEAAAVDLSATAEVGKPDSAGPDAADAPPPANYTCRNDADCCIVVDTCNEVAHLYSLAPGATGPPSISNPPGTMCVPCIPPAVQVRCDAGQCVGEKLSSGIDYNSPLRKDHCGPLALPDAGAASIYQPAYAGAQATSWGC
jgi:hypothetical protein